MSFDSSTAVATLRSLTVKFDQGAKMAKPFYPQVCTIVNSDGADEEYGLLGSAPAVREWIADRQLHNLRGAKFTVTNREYEVSIGIERTAIEDDRLGMYEPVMERLGMRAMRHPDKLLFELINGAESAACFDSQYFFDTDHSWGDSGSQSNDLTSTVSDTAAVTATEFRKAYHAARAAMIAFVDDNGEKLVDTVVDGFSQFLVVVPPALEYAAHAAFNSTLLGGGDSNVVLDKPMIVTSPHYSSAVKFDLYNIGDPLKPFVFQRRRPLTRQMKGLDDREFKDVKFMADSRYAVGYLAWWNAVRTTFST